MANAADNLVKKYPTREKQLRGPVYDYLEKLTPYSPLPQDLYLAVFYPTYRKLSPSTKMPSNVRRDNPGIKTMGDYVNMVNRTSLTAWKLSPGEEQTLKEVSNKLGIKRDALYRLIGMESGWDPKARNKRSGARGLIQFMPSTARTLGFKGSFSMFTILLTAGAIYLITRKKKAL